MPLTDDRQQHTSVDNQAAEPGHCPRHALPVPIVRGARQTTFCKRAQPELGDCTKTSTRTPNSRDRDTSPCKSTTSSQSCLVEGRHAAGTLLTHWTGTFVSQSKRPTGDPPTDPFLREDQNVPALPEEVNSTFRKECPWPSSMSDLRGRSRRSSLCRPRRRVCTAKDGIGSDGPGMPSYSFRECRSENGVVGDAIEVKDEHPMWQSVSKTSSLNDPAVEVQPLRSVQCKPTTPRRTAIAPLAVVPPRSVNAADLQTNLRPDGKSTGCLDKSDRPSWVANTALSSVPLDQSPVPSGSPCSPHRRPSALPQLLSHRRRTLCQPTHYQLLETETPVQRPGPNHAHLLHLLEEGPLNNGDFRTHLPNETCPATQLPESDEDASLPPSPRSVNSSIGIEDGTPMTSPSRSPIKPRPQLPHSAHFVARIPQLDGEPGDVSEDGSQDDEIQSPGANDWPDEADGSASPQPATDSDSDVFYSTYSFQPLDNGFTPLATPSLAQGSSATSFSQSSRLSQARARHPSTLLQQCERHATIRQRRLLNGGTQKPDRFIPSRAGTPTKQSLHLTEQRSKVTRSGSPNAPDVDPFGPVSARSLRMVDQYATVRTPAPPIQPVSVATRAEQSPAQTTRSSSLGAIWTVGGAMVTEGIASVTNGRGGRVTSGTNAPHYAADFLTKNSSSEDVIAHSKRLAVAMDIDRAARMLVHSQPGSHASSPSDHALSKLCARTWKDGAWHQSPCSTPTKLKVKVAKDVPIIPFRVLDAPALRDDYYCSLLSYSPTIQCLAVGLGPHVYLWSETRRSNGTPDSLTAPVGSAHVTSVSFSSAEGGSAILALGRADGRITLWSPLDRDPRFDSDQPSPISCLSFRPTVVRRPSQRDANIVVNTEELLVGDEVGCVYFYSVEWPNQDQRDLFDWHGSMTLLVRIECHSQQVCGLAWSSDGNYFATGGNDNQLFLFESKSMLRRSSAGTPSTVSVRASSISVNHATVTGQGNVMSITPGAEKHVFQLNAAVKALAFAPWQSTLLAAGGGSNDRCIHFFHTLSGSPLATIDCHAQVTSLVWSEKRKEIASTFGFAQPEHPYRVAVFAWPSCNMVVRIPWWSEERALFAVAYPGGPTTGQQSQGASNSTAQRTDAEGRPWYGKRTREEGCLVVATSDASIKFHEIWAEKGSGGGKRVSSDVFGGSQILEEEYTGDVERWGRVIR